MALWKYFKREVKTPLLLPTGSLSSVISSGGIVAANKEVQRVMDTINDGTLLKRGPYEHFDDEERAQIGRYAADHGVAAAVRHYQKLFPTRKVKEISVHTWRNKYLQDLQIRKEEGREMVVKKLPYKKRGRPLFLGGLFRWAIEGICRRNSSNGPGCKHQCPHSCCKGISSTPQQQLVKR